MQASVNKLSGTGGKILLANGTYNVMNGVNGLSNVQIIGTGPGTILNVIATSKASVPSVFNVNSNVVLNFDVKNMTIIGNNNAYITTGIYLRFTNNCNVEGNIIKDFRNRGISLDGTDNTNGFYNKVLGNYVEKTYADKISECIVLGCQTRAVVSNNTSVESFQGGITLSGCFDCTVIANTIMAADGQGLGYGGIDLEASSHNTIVGNTILSGTSGHSSGIRVSRVSNNNIFSSNNIDLKQPDGTTGNNGIWLLSLNGSNILNQISSNNVSYSDVGIFLNGASEDQNNDFTFISNNLIDTCRQMAIKVQYSNNVTIESGSIRNADCLMWGRSGINLVVSDYCTIKDISFIDEQNGTHGAAIGIQKCMYTYVSGIVCPVNASWEYGLVEGGGSDYTTVTANNTLEGTKGTGINEQALDILISGNHSTKDVTKTYTVIGAIDIQVLHNFGTEPTSVTLTVRNETSNTVSWNNVSGNLGYVHIVGGDTLTVEVSLNWRK